MQVLRRIGKWMQKVKNLDKKRVFDMSVDKKLIRLKLHHCVTTITANDDRTLNISHSREE